MTKIYIALFSLTLLFSTGTFAQIFPYYDAFDTYTAGQPLNGNGGFVATSHVKVTAHGVVGNCAEFQMAAASAGNDTLISPLIGPLTSHTTTSFYFRIVKYTGSVPSVYTLTGTDKAIIYVGNGPLTLTIPQYTITSANQNTTINYVKVTVAAPAFVNGLPGKFQIVAFNPSGHDWLLEMDSFVVKDTLVIAPVLTDSVTPAHCRGDSTGSIKVFATGASAPYKYHWSNGDTTATIINQPGGVYTVTVTDSLNATASLTDTISEPKYTLLLDSLTHLNIKCRGDATGRAEVYATGGTPAYTYLWNSTPNQTTQLARNLTAGNYGVTVTDSRNCTVSATTQITQPTLALTATMSSTGSRGNNGTATAIANGGTSPFTYVWSPTSQTLPIATNLAPGLYYVTITDGNSCTLIDSVVVSDLTGINEVDSRALQFYPNPTSELLYVAVDGGNHAPIAVSISDLSGRVVLADEAVTNFINISALTDGVYVVKVTSGDKAYVRRVTVRR